MQIGRRTYNLYANDNGEVVAVRVHMMDKVHHYIYDVVVRMDDGVILLSEPKCIRSPYPTCGGATAGAKRLVGLSVFDGVVRSAREHIGGSKGCHRLFELVVMACNHAWAYITNPADDLLIDLKRPELRNTCHALKVVG
jgi:hypothetical protein